MWGGEVLKREARVYDFLVAIFNCLCGGGGAAEGGGGECDDKRGGGECVCGASARGGGGGEDAGGGQGGREGQAEEAGHGGGGGEAVTQRGKRWMVGKEVRLRWQANTNSESEHKETGARQQGMETAQRTHKPRYCWCAPRMWRTRNHAALSSNAGPTNWQALKKAVANGVTQKGRA